MKLNTTIKITCFVTPLQRSEYGYGCQYYYTDLFSSFYKPPYETLNVLKFCIGFTQNVVEGPLTVSVQIYTTFCMTQERAFKFLEGL